MAVKAIDNNQRCINPDCVDGVVKGRALHMRSCTACNGTGRRPITRPKAAAVDSTRVRPKRGA